MANCEIYLNKEEKIWINWYENLHVWVNARDMYV